MEEAGRWRKDLMREKERLEVKKRGSQSGKGFQQPVNCKAFHSTGTI